MSPIESELQVLEIDLIVFYLCGGDLSKRRKIMKTELNRAFEFYYMKQLNDINKMIESLNSYKAIRK
jgi:hypothetical protein